MIFGAGKLSLISSLNTVDVFPDFHSAICYSLFTFRSVAVAEPASYLNLSGIRQAKSSKIQEQSYFVDLVLEDTDFHALQISLGELAASSDDITINEEEEINPLVSTVFNDSRINLTNAASIACYNLTDKQIMTAAPIVEDVGSNFFFVDGGTSNITFNVAQLGKVIVVCIPVVKQDIACIGGLNGRGEFYEFAFEGEFFTTSGDGPYLIRMPYLNRISAPVLNVSEGNAVTYTISFEAVCGEGFERKPFKIFSPTSGMPTLQNFLLLENGNDFYLQEDGTDRFLLENSN